MDIREFVADKKEDSRKVWQFTIIDEDTGEVLMVTKARIAAENKLVELLDNRVDYEEDEYYYDESDFDKHDEIKRIIRQKETEYYGIIVEEVLVDL